MPAASEQKVEIGGSLYKVHTGPKGGRFVRKNGVKIYVKKNF